MSEAPDDAKVLRVYVVDDHEIVREGLRSALPNDPGVVLVGEASTGEQALRDVRRLLPDMLLIDHRLPDTTGDELCRAIRDILPSATVIILTTHLSEDLVQRASDAGAAAFVTKAAGLGALRAAMAQAVASRDELQIGAASILVKRLHDAAPHNSGPNVLTPQQERILELTATGLTYAQIADQLHISESTVRFHLQRLKTRLGVTTKAELIATAVSRALISPGEDVPLR